MHIQTGKDSLLPILSQIQGLLDKGSAFPVFVNVLIEAKNKDKIQIYASDSELSFSAEFKGLVKKPGSLAVNGKKLFEIVRELSPAAFELSSLANNKVHLKQNQSVFKIHGLDPADFPKFPALKQASGQKLKAEDILDVIDKTLYCVSIDESRYHLTGVFLEQLNSSSFRFAATDGHRMSFIDIPASRCESLKKGIIIPRKGLAEIKKMLASAEKKDQAELFIEKPRLLLKFKNQSLSIRLIEGQYPDYKSLLPKHKGEEIFVSSAEFLSALRRISVLTSARLKGVNFTFKDNKLHIYFAHPETGEAQEELDCRYKGKEIKIRFNSKYILDILNSIYEEEIKIVLKDSRSPGLIQAKDKGHYTCLVMPMKL